MFVAAILETIQTDETIRKYRVVAYCFLISIVPWTKLYYSQRILKGGDPSGPMDYRGYKFESRLGHISFIEIDNEIISAVIFSLARFKKDNCQLLATVYAVQDQASRGKLLVH